MIYTVKNVTQNSYLGYWKNGTKDGYGNFMQRHDNLSYVGYYKKGKYHGIGKLKERNETFEGNWEEGRLVNVY